MALSFESLEEILENEELGERMASLVPDGFFNKFTAQLYTEEQKMSSGIDHNSINHLAPMLEKFISPAMWKDRENILATMPEENQSPSRRRHRDRISSSSRSPPGLWKLLFWNQEDKVTSTS